MVCITGLCKNNAQYVFMDLFAAISFCNFLFRENCENNLLTNINWFTLIEPCHEKTNVLVSDLFRHKPGCTATEDD